jgi:monoamine oxidase
VADSEFNAALHYNCGAMPGPSAFPYRRNRRAVIIGGSMSGLFTAAFLRQIGWDVGVYER